MISSKKISISTLLIIGFLFPLIGFPQSNRTKDTFLKISSGYLVIINDTTSDYGSSAIDYMFYLKEPEINEEIIDVYNSIKYKRCYPINFIGGLSKMHHLQVIHNSKFDAYFENDRVYKKSNIGEKQIRIFKITICYKLKKVPLKRYIDIRTSHTYSELVSLDSFKLNKVYDVIYPELIIGW